MPVDALAFEPQFLDHLAPIWRLFPPSHRGRFLVDPTLVERAHGKGIEAVAQPRPPHTVLQPKPNKGYRPALVAGYGDVKEGRRLGYGPFVFLEHGIGQSYNGWPQQADIGHASYAGGMDRDDNALILAPNETCASRWRTYYPSARVEIVGCPKLDGLPRKERDGLAPVIALTAHWPAPISISGYAGTAIGDYLTELPKLAKEFNVIGTAHPKGDWPARMQRTYSRVGIPFVADFEDVCRQADLLIFDNTSAGYEFAATGRPVVVLNQRYWSRKQSHGLRFWEAASVGVNVDRPEQLIPAVHEALADSTDRQEDREEALQLVYGLRHGGAEAAAAAIVDWLGERQVAAA